MMTIYTPQELADQMQKRIAEGSISRIRSWW